MDARPVMVVLMMAAVSLAGCLGGSAAVPFNARPEAGWIPDAHVGDRFEYDTWIGAVGQDGWSRGGHHSIEVRSGEDPHPWYDVRDGGYRVVTSTPEFLGTPREVYIDAQTGRIAGEFAQCPVAFRSEVHEPWTCYDRLAVFSSAGRGQPWAFGSSIFQGRYLYPGAEFRATFPVDRSTTTIAYRVTDAERHGDQVLFQVRGRSLDDEPVPFVQGEWTVSTAAPYALSHAHSTIMRYDGQTYLVRYSANLTSFVPGTGDALPRTSSLTPPPREPVLPRRALGSGVPPGLGIRLGWHGFGFGPALDHLAREDPNVANRMRADGFRVEYLQAPRATGGMYAARMPVTEDWLSASESMTSWMQLGAPGLGPKMHVIPWRCDYVGTPLLRDCGFGDPQEDSAWPSPYGPLRTVQAVAFEDAVAHVNASLPRPATLYRVMLVDNTAVTEAFEEAHYRYQIHYPALGNDGQPTNLLTGIALDARTGHVEAGFVEHAAGDPIVRGASPDASRARAGDAPWLPAAGDYRESASALVDAPPTTGFLVVG